MALDTSLFCRTEEIPLGPLLAGLPIVSTTGVLPAGVRGVTSQAELCRDDMLLIDYGGDHPHDRRAEVFRAAVVVCRPGQVTPDGVPTVQVADVRQAAGPLAARFWQQPGRGLDVVAITGTNGKSTTLGMCEAILDEAGIPLALNGTLGARLRDEPLTFERSTPEATGWQALMGNARDRGCRVVLTEATSGALLRHQLDPTPVSIAAWLNLGQDHLDIHGTPEAYRRAKARLFGELLTPGGVAILNNRDRRITTVHTAAAKLTFGLERGDLRVSGLTCDAGGSSGTISTPWGSVALQMPIPGRFNVENALAAAAITLALGVDREVVSSALRAFTGIPGRMQRVLWPKGPSVYVDYAHTPDAFEALLPSARSLGGGQLILVFGCGGERDKNKRQQMGRIASAHVDRLILTSDNPRGEEPDAIISQIAEGVEGAYRVAPRRGEAIRLAISEAHEGDIVVIAGKGHERTQIIGDVAHAFDDRRVAAEALASAWPTP